MNEMSSVKDSLTIRFQIHGDLITLLKIPVDGEQIFSHTIHRKASVKDVIESLGIPHPEIGRLTIHGTDIGFDYIVQHDDHIEIFPLVPLVDVLTPTLLRPSPLADIRFVVDVNVGKLASLLRMAGFDTAYHNNLRDTEIAQIAVNEKRIVLTRDTLLLKRKIVEYGHLIRETDPQKQLGEVINLFGLKEKIKPFSRCLRCNGILIPIAKEKIIHNLEPLTKKYYNTFHRCTGCKQIYWPGSHKDKMQECLDAIDISFEER